MPTLQAIDNKDEEALARHLASRGKLQAMPKCPIRSFDDFAIWYTPGVAAPSRAIAADRRLAYDYTNRANTVAIVSDGSRVLGLGNIGPEAALPVMEGKALLFKYLGGVDAVPICLDCHTVDEIVATVRALAPSFGGINLEDIETPKCFRVLEALRNSLPIPVWHDDQQGSAAAALAGLLSALRLVGKSITDIRIALIGVGAANTALFKILKAHGVDTERIIACDSKGILNRHRADIERDACRLREKWQICCESNGDGIDGGIAEALRMADVCVAFSRSGPGVIPEDAIMGMARDAIVFACANPVPEILPDPALRAGARIVATGRSDYPNQVNNSLVFPGLFRGVLDARAREITDDMALGAAHALADYAEKQGISENAILPRTDDAGAAVAVAAAVARIAQRQGLAETEASEEELRQTAQRRIDESRQAHQALLSAGCFAAI
jgi:malate dehydrogenase (oxaloacetate-decarboxylating)